MINLKVIQEKPYTFSNGKTDLVADTLEFNFPTWGQASSFLDACVVSEELNTGHVHLLKFEIAVIKDDIVKADKGGK